MKLTFSLSANDEEVDCEKPLKAELTEEGEDIMIFLVTSINTIVYVTILSSTISEQVSKYGK